MGKAGAIVKLLSSQNDDDNKIGHSLLETEDYYQYILDYMSEIINENRIKASNYNYWFAVNLKRRNR